MNSTAQKIEQTIEGWGHGKIFFADDFANMGSAENIRQTLGRLAKNEKIMRTAKGIYCYSGGGRQFGTWRAHAHLDKKNRNQVL